MSALSEAGPTPQPGGREENGSCSAYSANIAHGRASLERDLAHRRSRPQTTPLPLDAYAGIYESSVFGRMVWTMKNGRLEARIGLARSEVEVYNGAKYQLRVELTGSGSVVSFDVPPGASHPAGLRFMDETFKRRILLTPMCNSQPARLRMVGYPMPYLFC
jgi:hypothetical protein